MSLQRKVMCESEGCTERPATIFSAAFGMNANHPGIEVYFCEKHFPMSTTLSAYDLSADEPSADEAEL